MKVKYLGENDSLGLLYGKVYEVMAIEHVLYRIIDETKEDYLFFPDAFAVIEE